MLFRSRLAQVEDTFADLRGLKAGRLRLAVSTTGKYFAPRLLGAFCQRYPGVELSLQILNRQALLDRLAENADDLYIFASPPQDLEVACTPLLENPLVPFARKDHPLAHERNIPFDRFALEPFLIREAGSGTHMIALQEFEKRGMTPQVRMELGSNEAIKQAIVGGLGVSIMSRYTLGLDMGESQLTVLDVEGFPIQRHWYLVHPKGKELSLVARTFAAFVEAEAKQLIR